ncbi:unnamed protein product [Sphacelaria rigidula]
MASRESQGNGVGSSSLPMAATQGTTVWSEEAQQIDWDGGEGGDDQATDSDDDTEDELFDVDRDLTSEEIARALARAKRRKKVVELNLRHSCNLFTKNLMLSSVEQRRSQRCVGGGAGRPRYSSSSSSFFPNGVQQLFLEARALFGYPFITPPSATCRWKDKEAQFIGLSG